MGCSHRAGWPFWWHPCCLPEGSRSRALQFHPQHVQGSRTQSSSCECRPLFPLQACLLDGLPQLPLGPASFSCSWVVVTLCLERGPHSSTAVRLQPLLRPGPPPKLSQGKLGRGECLGQGHTYRPALRAKGLLDAPDGSLGLLNLLLGLEEPQARGPRLVLLLAWYTSLPLLPGVPPHLWGPWSPAFQPSRSGSQTHCEEVGGPQGPLPLLRHFEAPLTPAWPAGFSSAGFLHTGLVTSHVAAPQHGRSSTGVCTTAQTWGTPGWHCHWTPGP